MEDKTQASSGVSEVTGLTEVDPSTFLAEEEQAPSESTSEAQVEEAEVKTEAASEDETKEDTKQAEEAPLLAGKFKDEQSLKDAFTELGGNPDEYTDSKMLEEAYKVREREFSRTRQQMADLAKAQEAQEETPKQDQIAQVVEKIDWTKVKTYNDLVAETLKVSDQMFNDRFSKMKGELVSEIVSTIDVREKTGKELAEVEGDVPRLKTDPEFRGAFAHYITGLKGNGQYKSLKESMKSFLAIGQKITEEVAQQKKAEDEAKASAQSAEAKGTDQLSTSTSKDEADEIVDAFASRKNLFG